jgi:spectinomycin phosphotransferase
MRSVPDDIDDRDLREALSEHWGVRVAHLEHVPEGGGAHHWVGTASDDRRWFVTCDDLDTKPWLGPDRDSVFANLCGAYGAAVELRDDVGLRFVVAPRPTLHGDPAGRQSPRYAVSLFPFVDGAVGRWGSPLDSAGRSELISLLATLHASTLKRGAVLRGGTSVPGRERLEVVLGDLDAPWQAGPYAAAARERLRGSRHVVTGWLGEFDHLAGQLDRPDLELVVTHGEPHPGNLIHTIDGIALVDWDTVSIDRPERDLWMLDDGTGRATSDYEGRTGRRLDPAALQLYRLRWALSDLAAYSSLLHEPHVDNEDTESACRAIEAILSCVEPLPFGTT